MRLFYSTALKVRIKTGGDAGERGQKCANILGKDSGMFQRREEGLLALTAGRLRHGRHGCLTHIRRPPELRAGPGPLQKHTLTASRSRQPPTDSIPGESKVGEPSARWVTVSVYVGAPPPTAASSGRRMPLIPPRTLKAPPGSKAARVRLLHTHVYVDGGQKNEGLRDGKHAGWGKL